MNKIKLSLVLAFCFSIIQLFANNYYGLSLIPPDQITNKVDLDIRGGFINKGNENSDFEVSIYLNKVSTKNLLHFSHHLRSEERRVGKECRYRCTSNHSK